MAFQKSNATPSFQAPNIPGLVRQNPDLGGGLETLFNQYMQMQQAKRQEAALPGQLLAQQQQNQLGAQQLAAGQRSAGMADLQETSQFGAPLSAYSQQQVQQARQGFSPQGPGLPADQSRLQKLAEGLHAISQKQSQGARMGEAQVKNEEAQAAERQAKADALKGAQPIFNPATGEVSFAPRGAKILQPQQDKNLQREAAKSKVKLSDARALESVAIPELDRILKINENSRGGVIGAATQKISSAMDVGQGKTFQDTADTINSLKGMVAKVLKSTFGGQLSDSERAYLNEVYGAVESYTPTERKIAIENIKRTILNRVKEAGTSYSDLSGDTGTKSKPVSDPLGIL